MIQISDYIIINGELYHHGILGQKWGVRRYQNKDGSLTAAGKKHYSTGNANTKTKFGLSRKTKDSRKQTSNTEKKTMTPEEITAKKKAVLESRSAAELYKNANLFSDAELTTAYNRLVMEGNVKKLIPETKTKVDKFVDGVKKMSTTADEVSKAAENSIKVYNAMAKVSNSLFDTKLKTIMSDTERRDEKRKADEEERKKKKAKIEIDTALIKKEQAQIGLDKARVGIKSKDEDDDK